MLAEFYGKQFGKYNLIKEQIGLWCLTAKIGSKVIIASIHGTYVFTFNGKFKPRETEFTVISEDFDSTHK